jgi:hypothetical protein
MAGNIVPPPALRTPRSAPPLRTPRTAPRRPSLARPPGATAADETHVAQRKSLAAFASKYVSEADRKFLAGTTYTVQYFKYDWTLNEQKH